VQLKGRSKPNSSDVSIELITIICFCVFFPKDLGLCRYSHCFHCWHRVFWRTFGYGKDHLSYFDTPRCCWIGIVRRSLKPKEMIDSIPKTISFERTKTKIQYVLRKRYQKIDKMDHVGLDQSPCDCLSRPLSRPYSSRA
jgi:hypothetical protein